MARVRRSRKCSCKAVLRGNEVDPAPEVVRAYRAPTGHCRCRSQRARDIGSGPVHHGRVGRAVKRPTKGFLAHFGILGDAATPAGASVRLVNAVLSGKLRCLFERRRSRSGVSLITTVGLLLIATQPASVRHQIDWRPAQRPSLAAPWQLPAQSARSMRG